MTTGSHVFWLNHFGWEDLNTFMFLFFRSEDMETYNLSIV